MSRLARKTMWGGELAATAAGLMAIGNVGKDEGLRLRTYQGIVGVPTYCYGETQGAVMGRTHTNTECDALLLRRLDQFAGKVEHCVKAPMSDKTLVAFPFTADNVGINGFCGSTSLRLFNAGDRTGACRAMGCWNKAGGRVVPGLTARRVRKTALLIVLQNGWTAFSLVSLLTGAGGLGLILLAFLGTAYLPAFLRRPLIGTGLALLVVKGADRNVDRWHHIGRCADAGRLSLPLDL